MDNYITATEIKEQESPNDDLPVGSLVRHVSSGIIGSVCKMHPEFHDPRKYVLCLGGSGYVNKLYNYKGENWVRFHAEINLKTCPDHSKSVI